MTAHPERLVDVIVPTWNRRDLLLGCLASLAAQDLPHTVHVVDNGSTDGTVEAVRAAFPAAVVHALDENLGFGAAVNVAIRSGGSGAVVVTNNDVLAEPGFLARLVAPLTDPTVGSVAGVLLTADGTAVDAAGLVLDRGLAGYSHLHGQEPTALARAAEPFGPCGGAAAYRRSALEAVGLFDEELFAYSEDVDLALRLAAAGWRCAPAFDARARHLGSATLGRRSVAQLERSAFARGYVLGRYRVGVAWVVMETAVGTVDAVLNSSLVPLRARVQGRRRGRALPRRDSGRAAAGAMGVRAALRRRWASVAA